jgi:hypothetical protein
MRPERQELGVMARDQHRSSRAGEGQDDLDEMPAARGVEPYPGLVEEEDRTPSKQGEDEREPSGFARREPKWRAIPNPDREPDGGERNRLAAVGHPEVPELFLDRRPPEEALGKLEDEARKLASRARASIRRRPSAGG